MKNPRVRFGKLLYLAFKTLFRDHYTYRASALAFTTLLSLVPMLSIFVYIMAHFTVFSQLSVLVNTYIVQYFVPASSAEIISYLQRFTTQASQLPIFGILFLFFTTLMLVATIADSVKAIWHKKSGEKSLFAIFVYPLIVIFLPLFMSLSAFLSIFLFWLFHYIPAVRAMSFLVPLLINTILFTLLYLVTANASLRWRDALPGGLIAAFLLEAAKTVFAFYIGQFSNYALIYGALASLPIFLIWLYIFWLIILYGALIVKIQFEKNKSIQMLNA